jgi:hypothetical protein
VNAASRGVWGWRFRPLKTHKYGQPRVGQRRVKVTRGWRWPVGTGLDGHVNYMLVMRNERDDLVAIGPVSIEYQAAMIRDELEESAGWTTVGIARVLTGQQARTIAAAAGG